jgi:predicted ATPase
VANDKLDVMEYIVDQVDSDQSLINNEVDNGLEIEINIDKSAVSDLIIGVSEREVANDFQKEQVSKEIEMLKRLEGVSESVVLSPKRPVIIFGGNGSGKSTLARALGHTVIAEADIAWGKKFGGDVHFSNVSEWTRYQYDSDNTGQLVDLQKGFTKDLLESGIFSSGTPVDGKTKVLMMDIQEVLGKEMHRAHSDYMNENSVEELVYRGGRKTELKQQGSSSRQYIDERIDMLIDNQPESNKTILIIDEPDFALSPQRQKMFFDRLVDKCKKKGIALVMDNKNTIDSQVIEIKTSGSSELDERFKKLLTRLPEGKETEEQKPLEVDINTNEIESLIEEINSGIQVFGKMDENKKREIVGMLRNISGLGEKVLFGKGVNLIFGENGSGKSTLAKAIQVSIMASEYNMAPKRLVASEGSMRYGYDIAAELVNRNLIKVNKEKTEPENDGFSFSSGESVVMIDPLRGIGETASIYENAMIDSRGRREYMNDTKMGRGISQKESSRQTIEKEIVEKVENVAPGGVIIIDEAEGGLSPMDQERFHKLLDELGNRGYTVIVPTNSYYAYKNEDGRENRFFLGAK